MGKHRDRSTKETDDLHPNHSRFKSRHLKKHVLSLISPLSPPPMHQRSYSPSRSPSNGSSKRQRSNSNHRHQRPHYNSQSTPPSSSLSSPNPISIKQQQQLIQNTIEDPLLLNNAGPKAKEFAETARKLLSNPDLDPATQQIVRAMTQAAVNVKKRLNEANNGHEDATTAAALLSPTLSTGSSSSIPTTPQQSFSNSKHFSSYDTHSSMSTTLNNGEIREEFDFKGAIEHAISLNQQGQTNEAQKLLNLMHEKMSHHKEHSYQQQHESRQCNNSETHNQSHTGEYQYQKHLSQVAPSLSYPTGANNNSDHQLFLPSKDYSSSGTSFMPPTQASLPRLDQVNELLSNPTELRHILNKVFGGNTQPPLPSSTPPPLPMEPPPPFHSTNSNFYPPIGHPPINSHHDNNKQQNHHFNNSEMGSTSLPYLPLINSPNMAYRSQLTMPTPYNRQPPFISPPMAPTTNSTNNHLILPPPPVSFFNRPLLPNSHFFPPPQQDRILPSQMSRLSLPPPRLPHIDSQQHSNHIQSLDNSYQISQTKQVVPVSPPQQQLSTPYNSSLAFMQCASSPYSRPNSRLSTNQQQQQNRCFSYRNAKQKQTNRSFSFSSSSTVGNINNNEPLIKNHDSSSVFESIVEEKNDNENNLQQSQSNHLNDDYDYYLDSDPGCSDLATYEEGQISDNDDSQQQYSIINGNDNLGDDITKFLFRCDICGIGFLSQDSYQKHVQSHVKCKESNCLYIASKKLVRIHHQNFHETGLWDRVGNVNTAEDIARYILERRKNYPTSENVNKKMKYTNEKCESSNILEAQHFG
ncbi:unnamed protein product [Didymodactylos carnosus]|uniref:C2H2-type domain-containing protein n=1 Tax=Didymodactylos carnosus TaxID=1234261 RepID=A0A814NFU2_9BILA|nr:unnamed protein product [Didymodactylos carnosus]CAF1296783.1 unnamed protein product [Didymodactylos carnosus]CAF3857715.1 unnamed protein product [Didymodactylos carnosus]CAF4102050.1 unnamed protein product [Didymodactylos carnosus]